MEDAGGKTTPELNDKLDSLGRFLIVTVIALPVLSKFIDFKPFVSITGALSYGDLVMIFVTIGIVFFAKKQFDLQRRQHVFDRDMQEKNHEFEVKVQSVNYALALYEKRSQIYLKAIDLFFEFEVKSNPNSKAILELSSSLLQYNYYLPKDQKTYVREMVKQAVRYRKALNAKNELAVLPSSNDQLQPVDREKIKQLEKNVRVIADWFKKESESMELKRLFDEVLELPDKL